MKQTINRRRKNEIYCISKQTDNLQKSTAYHIEFGCKYLGATFEAGNPGTWLSLTGDDSIILWLRQNTSNKPIPGISTLHFVDKEISDGQIIENFKKNQHNPESLFTIKKINDNGHEISYDDKSGSYLLFKRNILQSVDFLLKEKVDREKYVEEFSHEEFAITLSRVNMTVKSIEQSMPIYEYKLGLKFLGRRIQENEMCADFLLQKKHGIILTLHEYLRGENKSHKGQNDLLLSFEPLYKHYYNSVHDKLITFPYEVYNGSDGTMDNSMIIANPDGYKYEIVNPYPDLSNEDKEAV